MSSGHLLVVGMTESGKSHLVKQMATTYQQQGVGVLVCDPMGGIEWPQADYVTDDIEQFMRVAQENRRCLLIVEEGGETIGNGTAKSAAARWLTTRSRHYGHRCVVIGQVATQIDNKIRLNCAEVIAFRQPQQAADMLAQQFGQAALFAKLPTLPQYTFLRASAYRAQLGRLAL